MKARKLLNRIPDRLLYRLAGLALSFGFIASPTLLAWWIMQFS